MLIYLLQPRGGPRARGEGTAEGEEVPVRPVRQAARVQVQVEGARGADAREEVDGHQVHRVRARLRPQATDGPPQEPRTLPGQVGLMDMHTLYGSYWTRQGL